MGSGQAEGEDRAIKAAEDALTNPLLGELTIKSAKGLLVNITGGRSVVAWFIKHTFHQRRVTPPKEIISNLKYFFSLICFNLDPQPQPQSRSDITLFELDRAAQRITDEIDDEFCNIIIGGGEDPALEGQIRVSIVATGIEEKLF